MNLNNFNIYSMVASNHENNECDLQKLFAQIKVLKKLDGVEQAKEYVKKIWGIEHEIENFALTEQCVLNITDAESTYCVNFVLANKDITYYYEKV